MTEIRLTGMLKYEVTWMKNFRGAGSSVVLMPPHPATFAELHERIREMSR